MKIETSRFGTLEVDENSILSFTRGMPGFPDEKRYVLLPHRENSQFYWLQSIDNPVLAFIATNPFLIDPEYSFEIPDDIQKDMDITDSVNVQIMVLVTVRNSEDGSSTPSVTVNMLGPVVVNTENMEARQLVLDPSRYDVQFNI